MSADNLTELDNDILEAFAALDATVPEDYFDDFESRVQARIEETAMTEISDPTAANSDDDELRDIRALAAKTRARVSQRMSATKAPEEPLISSVSLALKAISLPEPGKDFKFFAVEDTPKAAAAVANDERDQGLPAWIYAAISAVAAAAVVFFVLRGGDTGKQGPEVAVNDQASPSAEKATLARAGFPADTNPGQGPDRKPDSKIDRGQFEQPEQPNQVGAPGAGSPARAGAPDESGMGDMAVADGAAGAAEKGAGTVESNSAGANDPSAARSKSAATTSGKKRDRPSAKKRKKKASKQSDAEASKPDDKPPEKKKPKKPDTLESLLSEASGVGKNDDKKKKGKKKAAKKDATPAIPPGRTKIQTSEVRKAMTGLSGKTRACYEKYQKTGLVKIKFGVAPSGKVTSASATGKFKGTDTGKCIAAAVKTVKFAPFNGRPATLSWPFLLSQ